jgi:hypothetical protein
MAEANTVTAVLFKPDGTTDGLGRTRNEELAESQTRQKQNRQTQQRQHTVGGLLILSQAIMHQETTPFALHQQSLATSR